MPYRNAGMRVSNYHGQNWVPVAKGMPAIASPRSCLAHSSLRDLEHRACGQAKTIPPTQAPSSNKQQAKTASNMHRPTQGAGAQTNAWHPYIPRVCGEARRPELEKLSERPQRVGPDLLRLILLGKHGPHPVLDPAQDEERDTNCSREEDTKSTKSTEQSSGTNATPAEVDGSGWRAWEAKNRDEHRIWKSLSLRTPSLALPAVQQPCSRPSRTRERARSGRAWSSVALQGYRLGDSANTEVSAVGASCVFCFLYVWCLKIRTFLAA